MKMTQKLFRKTQCCMGVVDDGEEALKLFGQSWCAEVSPLFWRIPIFIYSIVAIAWSISFFKNYYFVYMTHWGLILICLQSLFGIIVTMKTPKEINPKTDATFGLPWYVKTYWVLYNISIPMAFLITAFFYFVLDTPDLKRTIALPPALDKLVHGANSGVMLLELVCSAHPSRLLHVYQPVLFALSWLFFSVIYYLVGGVDAWGRPFIYPVIDWAKPQQTMVVVTLTALFIILSHLIVVALAALRDAISRKLQSDSTKSGIVNEGFGI